jgi:uncharacterized protein YndB with AHSA1/START domain
MLAYILCALIVVVGIVLALAALKPDEFRISRSIVIDAPPERVFPFVDNLRTFATWSPYELKDPDMKRTFKGPERGKGAIYEWDGDNNVGKGNLLISDSRPSSLVAIDLGMERPIAVANLVTFTFGPEGSRTNVTWAMQGKSSFIVKIMHTLFSMDKMAGGDFELGLKRLKAAAEAA